MAKHPKTVSSESAPPQKKTKTVSLPSSSSSSSRQDLPPTKSLANLPEDILQNVFTFLPIRNAVQACTVSTKFKRSWTFNRKFFFGRDFALRNHSTPNLAALIDRIFDSHEGPEIQSFKLNIDPLGFEPLIEKWLKICIEKGIQELELNFIQRGFVLVPDFLDTPTLKIIKLYNCEIVLPPIVGGLKNLHTVILRHMDLTEESLQNLMLCCKMMSCLDLTNCSTIKHVNILARNHQYFRTFKISGCHNVERIYIDAPTLRSIHYRGVMMKIQFAQVLRLNEALFNFLPTRNYMQPSHVGALVKHLAHVRVLTTTAQFQEALTARIRDGVLREVQFRLWHLRELQMIMEGGSFCNPYDIAVFLKKCPTLEMLFIDLTDYQFECGVIWDMHHKAMLDAFNHYFDRLRVVKLKGFKFSQSELELLKILLQRSRFLDYLIFIIPKNGRTRLYAPNYKQLFSSWKASPHAKIAAFEHSNDNSGIYPTHPKIWY